MDAEGALYFPYMNVPVAEWFTRVLLYWDEVRVIQPRLGPDQEMVTPFTRELMRLGLVQTLDPATESTHAYTSGFREYLRSASVPSPAPAVAGRRVGVSLHFSKLGHGLAQELEDLHLAEPDMDRPATWYWVEPEAANALMAFLALGLSASKHLRPVTDSRGSLESLRQVVSPERSAPTQDSGDEDGMLIVDVLESLLPSPKAVDPHDLLEFKVAHQDELTRFRLLVEQVAMTVLGQDPSRRVKAAELVRESTAADLRRLTSMMERRSWRNIGVGALGVLGAALPAATGEPLAVAGSALAIVPAIENFLARLNPDSSWKTAPLAYAALAQNRFPS